MRGEKFKEVYATTTLINFLLFSVERGPMGAMKKDTVGCELNLREIRFWKLLQQNQDEYNKRAKLGKTLLKVEQSRRCDIGLVWQ